MNGTAGSGSKACVCKGRKNEEKETTDCANADSHGWMPNERLFGGALDAAQHGWGRNIADLQRMENRVSVKKAVMLLPTNSFTLKQLEVAAAYLTGKDLNLTSKDQAEIMLLRELE